MVMIFFNKKVVVFLDEEILAPSQFGRLYFLNDLVVDAGSLVD
jgi:hypothetical protein